MEKVTVNGRTYKVYGDSVSIINNKIFVDGKLLEDTSNDKSKNITVNIYGDVETLETGGNVSVDGNVGSINVSSGDVRVKGNVSGDCKSSSGDITINGNVDGSCSTTSGDISAKTINGSCKSMSGDISGRSFIPKVSDWMPK